MAVYLDNNATTRTDPRVVAAMLPFFSEHYGNPSSSHALGEAAKAALRRARAQVQALIGAAQESEILFTSGGTESNTSAILSALAVQGGRNEIITSLVEHPSVLALCDHLEATRGVVIHRIGVDREGRLDEAAYTAALSTRTALVSLMWANSETGVLFPVRRLAEQAKAHGALFHSDAVQAVGKVSVNVSASAIDLLSLSAHKWHGPKGAGALYLRKGLRFAPLLLGGKQERGRRPGTENVPAVVGMGEAARLAHEALDTDMPRLAALRDGFERALCQRLEGVVIAGEGAERAPTTSLMLFAGVDSEELLHVLDREGFCLSQGSACSSGRMEPSPVLKAMGWPDDVLPGAVRLSLSRETRADDLARLLAVLPPLVARLRARSLSPVLQSA